MTTKAELLALVLSIDRKGISYAKTFQASGGGTQWIKVAADCFAVTAALRAIAAKDDGDE